MALTKSDKDWFERMNKEGHDLLFSNVKNFFNDEMKERDKKIDRHDQTLYGSDGQSGMKKVLNDVKKEQEAEKKFRWTLAGASGVLSFVAAWVADMIWRR